MTARRSWLPRDGSIAGAFERRAARAEALAGASINAPALQFAAGLYRAQAPVATALAAATLRGSIEADLELVRGELEAIVAYAGAHGPPGLRAEVDAYRRQGAARWIAWWRGSRSGHADYLARAVLRPYGEALAATHVVPELAPEPAPAAAHGCPCCGGPPWIGWLRAGAGDEAPQRFLGCGACGHERLLNRIACAACGETAPARLAVFRSERHPAVRLEACDACRRYVKSIDLTVDGRAIPEVDDLCSLSMDLWAGEQGYERIDPSLAGV